VISEEDIYLIGRKILYKELAPVLEAMSSNRHAVVKGEALSQQIYGRPDIRRSCDVDILVDKSDVKQLELLLRSAGFEQQDQGSSVQERENRILCLTYSHQIPSYHKFKYWLHLNVDVNYDIFWGEYEGQRCTMKEFLHDVTMTEIYGFPVNVLTVEKAFVQLILHHYKEMNSLYHLSHGNCIRTKLFRDVYDMVRIRCDVLDKKCVADLCEQYRIGEIVYYMLFYTAQVFHDACLENLVSELAMYRNDELLESYGLCTKERKKWKIPFADRLDNNELWNMITAEMTETDLKKIALNDRVFT